MGSDSVSLRLQQLQLVDQILVLGRLAQSRMEDARFGPADLDALFDDLGLPRPRRVANDLLKLEVQALLSRKKNVRSSWRLTPKGEARVLGLVNEMDQVALIAESTGESPPQFGHTAHPTLAPWLAPPQLIGPLRQFLEAHPFDLNVFGMTRFPDEQDDSDSDPVTSALTETRKACADHGLEFHLASDRKIVDDLWQNVDAHMWGCRYGVAFFEDRRDRGVNYNLTIEVGGMMTTGRRLALLKDASIERLPTDLVGKIYTSVDLDDPATVGWAIHDWLRDDLSLGVCDNCKLP